MVGIRKKVKSYFYRIRKKIVEWRWWIAGSVVVIFFISVFFIPDFPDKTGFDGKTLWDLMDLLIVPILLALGALWFNREQRKRELQIAKEREEERLLQNYFDTMKELLLEYNLRNSGEGSEVRSVARTRTLAVLREVNPARKTSVMQFLIDADLVGADTTERLTGREREVYKKLTAYRVHNVINLKNADLRWASLSGASLIWANLSGADLSEANLSWAFLSQANLNQAKLSQANLSQAVLIWSSLSWADLSQADLSQANLRQAVLGWADLSGANLSEAKLSQAFLSGANLSGANLNKTNLSGADLSGANLRGANLRGANLFGADLSGADLSGAKYSSNTKWPDGFNPKEAGAILET